KKLSQAAIDFKAVQRDITNSLRTAESLIRQAPIQARPSLESAIKQLDNAILKSEFMLYTDMKTEKQLLQASSQLHEARKLLNRGERGQASEIIHQVRQTVRSEEHTSELQSRENLVCRLLLEKKNSVGTRERPEWMVCCGQ